MAGTDGGISDNAIIAETRPRGLNESGFASLGNLLGGGDRAQGEMAYANGMRIGAQTIDALAQAKQRITQNQQAEQAAQVMGTEGFQSATGIDPSVIPYAQTAARAGVPPQEITSALTAYQQMKLRSTVSNPDADPRQRLSSALGLDPAGAIPKAEGLAGNFSSPLAYDPSQPAGPNNTPVYVSPQQSAENQGTINKNQAATALDKARLPLVQAQTNAAQGLATQRQNNPEGATGQGGLKKGFMWAMDPANPGEIMKDGNGIPMQVPNPTAGGEGAVQQRYTARMVNASRGLANETENLAKIGFDTSSEAQVGSSGHGGSIMDLVKNATTKSLSSEDSKNYASSMVNVDRQLGLLELAGGIPPGTYSAQLKQATTNFPGDTYGNRLYHAAIIRQIAEQAAGTAEAGQASEKSKEAIFQAVARIQKAIPFTANEIIDFQRQAKPNQTLQQYLDSRPRDEVEHFGTSTTTQPTVGGPPGATPPASDPLGILRK